MNVRTLTLLLAALVAWTLLPGCGDSDSPGAVEDPTDPGDPGDPGDPPVPVAVQKLMADVEREESPASQADVDALVGDHTSFALWMYHRGREAAGEQENFLFSPFSISSAFAMLWPGGVGETAAEIAAMMHFRMMPDQFHPAANRLMATLASRNDYTPGEEEGDAPILEIVNDLWGLDEYPYVDEYLELLARHYGAGMWIVDFLNAWEEARQDINKHIEYLTRGLIPELLPEDSINEGTRLVLTNVVYFKGAWRFPFQESATRPAPFRALDGSTSDVPMMSGGIDLGRYAQVGNVELVELDYVGDGLSMVLLVPEEGAFAAFEEALDAEGLREMMDALRPMEGSLAMPKFAFESELNLVPIFREAGYDVPFSDGVANFSGLSETAVEEGLHVTGAFHKARIIVDEEGTEAAAATAIVVGTESAPLERFDVRADRPFLFVLRDRPTGAVLFMGRVVDAAAAQE